MKQAGLCIGQLNGPPELPTEMTAIMHTLSDQTRKNGFSLTLAITYTTEPQAGGKEER